MSFYRKSVLNSSLYFALFLSATVIVSGQQIAHPSDSGDKQQIVTANASSASRSTTVDSKAAAAQVTEFEVNGMKVLVKRREGSQTVAGGVFFRGGTRNINAQNAGIESLMLSVATEASQSYPRDQMRSALSRLATSIGSGAGNDFSVLSLVSTRANFDRSWDIFTDIVLHPSFTDQDVNLVKSRTIAGLQSVTDDPDAYLQDLLQHTAFAGHPYLNDPQGSVETVGKITSTELKAYHQKLLQTSRMLIVLVGDLDGEQLKARITAAYGKLPRGDYKPASIQGLEFTAPSVDVTERALPTNYVRGLYGAPSLHSPDYYPMQVASAILNNRVLVEVRFKRNLSYAPEAFLGNDDANTGGLYVTAVDANQAVKVMLDEVNRLKQVQIEKTDVSATVAEFLTKYYLGQETNAAQVAELAKYELLGGGWRNAFDFIDRLKSVTPVDVQRVSQKYMKNLKFEVLGNPASVDKKVFTYGDS